MTPAEYMSAEKFPLTTQKGLSVEGQLLIDAHNLDSGREWAETHTLSPEDQAVQDELEAKAKVAPAVRAALKGKGK